MYKIHSYWIGPYQQKKSFRYTGKIGLWQIFQLLIFVCVEIVAKKYSPCALKLESEISPLKNCFNVGFVTKKLRIWNFDGLRTFIFYQFGEWKFPKPPYGVCIAGHPVDANPNRLRTPVQLEDNLVLKIQLLKVEKK